MRTLFICVVSILCLVVGAQGNNDHYNYWTMDIDKGLSHSNVTSILVDSQGVLWVGTSIGLNRYDQYQIETYFSRKNDIQSLPDNYIYFIAEGCPNTIFVSTRGGMVQYDKGGNQFKQFSEQTFIAFSSYATEKECWFGGTNTLYRYDYDTQKNDKIVLSRDSSFQINNIFGWRKDVLLLITKSSGIWEYHCQTRKLTPSVFSSRYSHITAAYVDAQKNVYLGVHNQGLFILDRYGKERHHLTTANSQLSYDVILSIVEKKGCLWLATDGGGITIMNLKQPFVFSSLRHIQGDMNSLPGNSIQYLHKDKWQNIWVGSIREGLFRIKESAIRTYKETVKGDIYGVSNKSISSLCEDKDGFIWIGTDGGGLNRFNPNDRTFKHYPNTYGRKIISVVEYSPSQLLFSSYNEGVYLFNKKSGQCIPFHLQGSSYSEECRSGYLGRIYQLSANRLLFLAQRPYLYHKQTGKIALLKTRESPHLLASMRFVGEHDNLVYLQQGDYLFSADLQTDSVSLLFHNTDREKMQVVHRDSMGIFWIGTDQGLRTFNPITQKYEKIRTDLFTGVTTIVAVGENLWIGAQNSLFSYSKAMHKFSIWQESDGYSPNYLSNIYYVPRSSPFFYLGGTHGLVQISKNIGSINSHPPQFQLTDVILDKLSRWSQLKKENSRNRSLSVPWDYKSLQLKITVVASDILKKRLYRYDIFQHPSQNKPSKSVETYNPILDLDFLTSGEYIIKVSCYTNNGEWTAPQEILQLTVLSPWYKDYRVLLPIILVLLALFCRFIVFFMHRREEKMQWEMSEKEMQMVETKNQFLVNISHELRTPLTLIYAPLKRIVRKLDTNNVDSDEWRSIRNALIHVCKSADRMKDIIHLALDTNHANDRDALLDKQSHLINEWVCSVAEEFRSAFELKQIELIYALNESVDVIDFDDDKCHAVLSNLLMNALKFSFEGGQVILSSELTSTGVRISVSDQGMGLNHVEPQKLFTRFYQGNHRLGGSGIGLSYAKEIIDRHGGTMGAINHSDRGATFYFELPLSADIDMLELQKTISVDTHLFPNTYSVVIVEDNTALRSFLADALKDDFAVIYQVANGLEAWDIIFDKIPDMIISDVMMPLMNGYELCSRVKSEMRTSHIPIVLLTARGDADSTALGYQLGADVYLSKPFDLCFLQIVLKNQLRNREQMRQRYREVCFQMATTESVQCVNNKDEEFLLKFNKLILDHLSSTELDIKFLTEHMNMSRSPLYAKIKALTNMGVNEYINRLRIEKGAELLLNENLMTIADISVEVGFEYQCYFSTLFKQVKGVTPSQYRKNKA
ncbi:MAG: response regulator [Bacteroides sp.]|uniref:response regulator n=1 Tax=Bacteroides sp. TaxID=29523 RepID=UPI002FCC463E